MKKTERFDKLCELMVRLKGCTFSEYCRKAGLSERVGDNLCYAHFGISGEDILSKIQDTTIVIAI